MPAANNPPITRRANEPSASAGETPPVLGRDGAEYCEAAAAVALAVAEALVVALAVGLGWTKRSDSGTGSGSGSLSRRQPRRRIDPRRLSRRRRRPVRSDRSGPGRR